MSKKHRDENLYIREFNKNYRAQIRKLEETTSFFVEFLNKSDLSPELTKKLLNEFGSFRECFLNRGRTNFIMYSSAATHLDTLRSLVKNLKEKKESKAAKPLSDDPPPAPPRFERWDVL